MTKDQLRIARVALGMTQAELGETLGRSRSQMFHYENGTADIPLWMPWAIRGLSLKAGGAGMEVARLMSKLESENG